MPYTNAVIYFITPSNRLLIIKSNSDNKWTTPAGHIDITDTDSYATALREFYQKVGTAIDPKQIAKQTQDIYNYNTMIYIIYSNQNINFSPNRYASKIKFIKLHRLLSITNDISRRHKFSSDMLKSFKQLIQKGLINPIPNSFGGQTQQIQQIQPTQQIQQIQPIQQIQQIQPTQPNLISLSTYPLSTLTPTSNIQTLIYVGEKFDKYIPWGGYHITIAGHNQIDRYSLYNIVKNLMPIFSYYNGYPGWIMKSTSIGLYLGLDSKYYLKIRSDTFDRFAYALSQFGIQGVRKANTWHISMQTSDLATAQAKVYQWTTQRHVFNIYIVEHDIITNKIIWYLVA